MELMWSKSNNSLRGLLYYSLCGCSSGGDPFHFCFRYLFIFLGCCYFSGWKKSKKEEREIIIYLVVVVARFGDAHTIPLIWPAAKQTRKAKLETNEHTTNRLFFGHPVDVSFLSLKMLKTCRWTVNDSAPVLRLQWPPKLAQGDRVK